LSYKELRERDFFPINMNYIDCWCFSPYVKNSTYSSKIPLS